MSPLPPVSPEEPVEPPASAWIFPDLAARPDEPDDDLVAMGADLEAGTLLSAYRRGLFPMPAGDPGTPMLWWSPLERGVLPLDGLKVTRSLRASARKMEVRVDTAFDAVIRGCADPNRDSGWIDEEVLAAYSRLHELGWVHSVEAWQDGELVGGLYGVAIGGLFAGESMFHRARDASKVALVGLVDLLRDEHADDRLLDVQWSTPHLASLGVVEVPRAAYLPRLRAALDLPLPAAFRRPADRRPAQSPSADPQPPSRASRRRG
ncbi:MAG TPA: leucyl/phenylalanyl-tRNA--protein transferase [Nocardioidaceae bacterium]|jgi:leucyl/phenylalanyl-tRNA--protein transferase|nr:leucyl/phenylalanyl-tRNA--protein transferase [Nocardioidaceae bacterium]